MIDTGQNLDTIKSPPQSGPGSSRAAWIAFAIQGVEANDSLSAIIKDQSAAILELQAEVRLLRKQIAERKPGGRPRLPDETVRRIEAELKGGVSCRGVAKAFSVSPMTVSRIKTRMAERAAPS